MIRNGGTGAHPGDFPGQEGAGKSRAADMDRVNRKSSWQPAD